VVYLPDILSNCFGIERKMRNITLQLLFIWWTGFCLFIPVSAFVYVIVTVFGFGKLSAMSHYISDILTTPTTIILYTSAIFVYRNDVTNSRWETIQPIIALPSVTWHSLSNRSVESSVIVGNVH
jgi:hypothetical protein